MGRPLDGALCVLAHGSRFLSRRVQGSARIQLGHRCRVVDTHLVAFVHRLLVAMGPVVHVGRGSRNKHDGLYTGVWFASAFRVAWWCRNWFRNLVALVRVARAHASVRNHHLHGDPLLASPQGRRNFWTALIGDQGKDN